MMPGDLYLYPVDIIYLIDVISNTNSKGKKEHWVKTLSLIINKNMTEKGYLVIDSIGKKTINFFINSLNDTCNESPSKKRLLYKLNVIKDKIINDKKYQYSRGSFTSSSCISRLYNLSQRVYGGAYSNFR